MGMISVTGFRFGPGIFLKTAVVVLAILAVGWPGSGLCLDVKPAQLNRWYDIRTPGTPVNWSAMPKMFQAIVRKAEPYVAIYRFELTKGQKYTFQSEYPADHIKGSICLRGVNPLAASKQYSAPSGSAGLILCHNRGFPGGNIKGYIFGRKSNFTTSLKSQHNNAYLVITSAKPNTPFRLRMIEPAESDDFIRKKGYYKLRPNQDPFYSWSNVHKNKLWMGYAKGENRLPPAARVAAGSPKASAHKNIKVLPGKKAFAEGEKIAIRFSGLPGNKQDWITIVKKGTPANKQGQWFYTNAKKAGVLNFKGLAPGEYEIRVYLNWPSGGYNIAVRQPFKVGTPAEALKKAKPSPRIMKPLRQTPDPAAQTPGSLAGWIRHIQSGKTFLVIFDKTKDKFDDAIYSGDWRTDPMGTLKGGETYQVVYKGGKFTCRGYHQHKKRVFSSTNGGINPKDARISLWGRTYVFDGQSQVWDQKYGIVGHLGTRAGDSTTPATNPKGMANFRDYKGNTIKTDCGLNAFADALVAFEPGNPKPIASALNPNLILGKNDYNEPKDVGYVSLGCGGTIVVGFSRVAIVDVKGPDLYVFEIGSSVEPMKVELSKDGQRWVSVGTVRGGTGALDIHGRVIPGEQFRYVRLTDLKSSCTSSKWPGADVYAVAAIGCIKTAAPLPHLSGTPSTAPTGSEPAVSFKTVASRKIPPSGGTLTVNKPGDPLHGFSITVPSGAYTQTKAFTISAGLVPSRVTGKYVNPITPLIRVENGGDYANELMAIKIPMKRKSGYFTMPFFLDTATGKLEGMPVLSWHNDHIVAVTRHFSAFFVSAIAIDTLEKLNKIDTGFSPGRDNWGFINEGSYTSPGGICSGMTMTAMWYYLEQFKTSRISLQRRFDNLPRGFATPGLGRDDSLGIRWASVAQKDLTAYSQRVGLNVIKKWEQKGAQKFDQGVWYCFAYSMLVTREPQFVSIWGLDTADNSWYGHALAAYAIDMNTGVLSIYDPNYEISKGRKIFFDRNTKRFKNYTSALNAKQLETGSGLPFEKFKYFAKSAMLDWKKLGKRWQQVEAESIAQGLFPTYQWKIVDKKNRSLGKISETHQTHKDIIRLKLAADVPTGFYPKKTWRVTQLGSTGERPTAVIAKTSLKAESGVVDIPLKPGLNRIGIRVVAKPSSSQSYEWLGFDWFVITRSKVLISPENPQATLDIPLAFKASIEPPFKRAIYRWDWGDGAAMETGSQNAGAHTWTKPGTYTVSVAVKDRNDHTPVGQTTTRVTVAAEVLPAKPKASGCPEDLLAWCQNNNFRPLKCLKCKPRVKSISGCVDCDFPRTYRGSGGWTMVATSTVGAKKTGSCSEMLTVTAELFKGRPRSKAPARFTVDGIVCVDRDRNLSPTCSKCPGKPMQFEGWHDQKGRAGFEIQSWGVVFDIRYDGKTMSSSASGKMDWGDVTQGEDLATNSVSFKLKRVS